MVSHKHKFVFLHIPKCAGTSIGETLNSYFDEYWKNNPYGWRRWEAVLAHMNQKDNSFLLPGFKEYVNKLDAIRGVNAKNIFPELGHLL